MEGAREYAKLFKTGQHGRLYLTSGEHARGKTFRIQVLPEGEEARGNGSNNVCLNHNAVVVFGELGGQSGWTEYYGWKHEGKWQEDFQILVDERKKELSGAWAARSVAIERDESSKKARIENLLSEY